MCFHNFVDLYEFWYLRNQISSSKLVVQKGSKRQANENPSCGASKFKEGITETME